MKNVAIIPFLTKDESSISSVELEVLGVPIYQLTLDSVVRHGQFDQVFIISDISRVDFNNKDFSGVQGFAFPSDLGREDIKVRSSIFEIINESVLEEEDWITLINPSFPFQNFEYFKVLKTKIWQENVDYIYPRVELVDQSFGIEEQSDQNQASKNNHRYRECGLFKSIRVRAMLNINSQPLADVDYVDVRSSDDVAICDIKDIYASYPRLNDMIVVRTKNYTERVFSDQETDYFDVKTDPDGVERDFLNEVQGRLDFAQNEIKEVQSYLSSTQSDDKVNILDIGCGTGVISSQFKGANVFITGIEPSQIACDLAANRLDRVLCGFYENFTDEFSDASFDVVFVFHVIEHVQSPNQLLSEISRVLKPGGLAVISTPDFEGPMAKKYGKNFRLYNDPTHISLFGMTGLIKSIEARNLSIVKIDQPFIETKYFTKENVMRLFNEKEVSPPFTGNVVSIYVTK